MVYIGNICRKHEELEDGFELMVKFKSGNSSYIKKDDKLKKLNGDLQVTRYYNGQFLCEVIMDCAEIESLIIKKEK